MPLAPYCSCPNHRPNVCCLVPLFITIKARCSTAALQSALDFYIGHLADNINLLHCDSSLAHGQAGFRTQQYSFPACSKHGRLQRCSKKQLSLQPTCKALSWTPCDRGAKANVVLCNVMQEIVSSRFLPQHATQSCAAIMGTCHAPCPMF